MPALQALYYAGAKTRQLPQILPHLLPLLRDGDEFREPFAGSGAVSLAVMARCPGLLFWLNDRDPAMACLWWALRYHGTALVSLIEEFSPTPEAFEAFKRETDALLNCPDDPDQIIRVGFMKLARHRVSHSGYGSGIRGGRHQEAFKIDSRWNVERMRQDVLLISNRLRRCDARITGYDWSRLLDADSHSRICYYLDPPYLLDRDDWEQQFFSHGFQYGDHVNFAETLKTLRQPWVLTLGDSYRVRCLYEWAQIVELGARELIITNKTKAS